MVTRRRVCSQEAPDRTNIDTQTGRDVDVYGTMTAREIGDDRRHGRVGGTRDERALFEGCHAPVLD